MGYEMRTVVSCCRSAPAFTRRIFYGDPLFSSSMRRITYLSTGALLKIRFSQHWLSFSTLSLSASSPPRLTCSKAEQTQENLTIEHIEGFSDLLNAQKADDIVVGGRDLDKTGEEEEDEHGYSDIGSGHIPVLLSEVLAAFQDVELHTFVDCTLGAAGHASSIIMNHPELKKFIALEVDPVAHSEASSRLQGLIERTTKDGPESSDLKLYVLKANFKNVKHALHQLGPECQQVDGVLMDLGMSSMQLNVAERGFSLQLDGPLDMRMDPMASTTASDILNTWPEVEIGRIIREYGEERHWRRLAQRISEAQHLGGIHSTSALLQLIQKSLPSRFSSGRAGWKKTAIRVFQALRIAVNDELSSLKVALPDVFECLKPGGRLAVISFHSLEDRIVKQFFLKIMGETVVNKSMKLRASRDNPSMPLNDESKERESNTRGIRVLEGTHATILTKRPLVAGLDEVKLNPRARSAKLRILVKK